MCASYIENSLQKKSDLFKKTGLREENGYLTIPKNPYGFLFIVAVTLHRFEPFRLSPSKFQMRSTELVPTPHISLSMFSRYCYYKKSSAF